MKRGPDPARQLLRALERSAAAAGCTVELRHEALTHWASATFTGAQHRVVVLGHASAWLTGLAETELPLHGHYVASLAIEPGDAAAILTVLVLEK